MRSTDASTTPSSVTRTPPVSFARARILGCLILVLGLSACQTTKAPAPAEATSVAESEALEPVGTLTACMRPLQGFLAISGADADAEGLEADLLYGFAESARLQVETRVIEDFAEVLAAVEAGTCDVAAAAITITEARRQIFDFSESYFPSRVAIVERGSAHLAAEGVAGLASARVAVVEGTLQDSLISAVAGVERVHLADDEAMWKAVAAGDADALICDAWQTIRFMEKFPGLHVTAMLPDPTFFGFAMPKDSPIREDLDRYLAAQQENGAYRALLIKHFGEGLASSLLDD